MKIERLEGGDERTIVTAMIVDTVALSQIAPRWDRDLLRNEWAAIVAGWCVDYYQKYNQAPMVAIQGLFEAWSDQDRDKDTIKLVERFLAGLNSEYEAIKQDTNSQYVVDLAGKHFTKVRLSRMVEGVEGDLAQGEIEKAEERARTFESVRLGGTSWIDVLQDQGEIRAVFEQEEEESLIAYPEKVKEFLKGQLQRGNFVTFLGAQKKGKSFYLCDLAWRASQQRRRTAFFAAGDMTKKQMMRRFVIRACKRPLKAGEVTYPKAIRLVGEGLVQSRPGVVTCPAPLTWAEAVERCAEAQTRTRSKENYLRLECHPSSTLRVADIRAKLQLWAREGWVADVVVVDYADIMALPASRDDFRHRTDALWKELRALAQEFNCLVVTATQSNAAGGVAQILGRMNFSEDTRKLAHVTGMIGINQTTREKEMGVYRLNWIVLREEEFFDDRVVHVGGSLALANPIICSC